MLHENPAGFNLRLFVATLQRGGTCEAHGIGYKSHLPVQGKLFFYLLKLDVLKNHVLEASGLDFGGPGIGFWRVGPQFWRVLGPK